MRLLLDTHVFLWVVTDDRRLKRQVRDLIRGAESVFVSAASIWEIAIKAHIGKLEGDPTQLTDAIAQSGFAELPVSARHGALVGRLPNHHDDPFDRLLVAQAMHEPLRLLTADRLLARYSELVQVI